RRTRPRRRGGAAVRPCFGVPSARARPRAEPVGAARTGSRLTRICSTSMQEHETGVVGGAHGLRLIPIAHQADSDEVGNVSFEVRAELGGRIDLLFLPGVGGSVRLE